MRPIKFRAWDRNLKKWCDGNDARGFNLFGETLLIGGILQDGYYSHNVFERLFADVEIMQFTGLHDKNGKEIWEGDILKHSRYWQDHLSREYSQVIFAYGCFEFTHSLVDHFTLYTIASECEVLGNIYENGDLLK